MLNSGIKGVSIPASQAFCAEGEGFFEIVNDDRIEVYIMKSALSAKCLPGQILLSGSKYVVSFAFEGGRVIWSLPASETENVARAIERL